MTIRIKRKTVDAGAEKQFLTAAIVSDEFVKQAAAFYDPDLVETGFVRTVAEWCFRYATKYGKAPGLHIKDIFDARAGKMEPSERDLVAQLLSGLSEEHERAGVMNVQYLLDQSEALFRERSLQHLTRTINGLAADGDVSGAEAALSEYKRVGRPQTLGANPFRDPEAIQRAFERVERPLLTVPGRLGRLINASLNRDQFVAFLGPEKRGKTWWLNELALRAMQARCNVALFQIGDMSYEQVIVRLAIRLCHKSNKEWYTGDQPVPVLDCRLNQEGGCRKCPHKNKPLMEKWTAAGAWDAWESGDFSNHVPCTVCKDRPFFRGAVWWEIINIPKPLGWREAWRAGNRLLSRTRGRDFRLSVHPSDSLSVTGLKMILDNWETFEGFVPDVIAIDYADNLDAEAEDARKEPRHQENRKWKLLRGLSQERHCLVLTATQAAARSYKKQSVEMDDFSEDKRKLAHVTAMFGLNQTPAEKRAGLMRIGPVVLREDEFFTDDEATVAQSLRTGRPLVFSF